MFTAIKDLFLGPGDYDDLDADPVAHVPRSLRAALSQVKDLHPIEGLKRWTGSISRTRWSATRSSTVASLVNVTELILDEDNVSDLTPIANLKKLERLSIKKTLVKDLTPVASLNSLKFIYIADTAISDITPVQPLVERRNEADPNRALVLLWGERGRSPQAPQPEHIEETPPAMFEALGAFVFRYRWLVLGASSAFLAVALVVLARGADLAAGEIYGLEAGRAQAIADRVTGHPADTTFLAVFHDHTRDAREHAFLADMEDALAPLYDDPRVLSVLAPQDLPAPLSARMVDAPGSTAYALVTLRGTFQHALKDYAVVRTHLRSKTFTIECTGRLPYMHDLDATLEHDLVRAELVSLPLALLVLLLVFRTVVAATLPVGAGGLAVLGGIAVVFLLSNVTEIAEYTVNVCSLIGLGVSIDYSLFLVSRYREELAAGHGKQAALVKAVSTAGRVVAFSGRRRGLGARGAALLRGVLPAFDGDRRRMVVVALAVVFALTFLPALLAVLGDAIHAGRLARREPRADGGFWRSTALCVMKRPLLFLLPTLAVLLVMGVPFLHIRLATADVRVLSSAVEARRAVETLRQHFPDQAKNRIIVAVSFPTAPRSRARMTRPTTPGSRRLPHVTRARLVESPTPT